MNNAVSSLVVYFIFTTLLYAQSNWKYYSSDVIVNDVEIIGDELWIAAATALHVFDIETGKRTYLQSWNSPLRGHSVSSLEHNEDYVWITFYEGGVARFKRGKSLYDEQAWEQYCTGLGADLDTLKWARDLRILPDGDIWFDSEFLGETNFKSLVDGKIEDLEWILPDQTKSLGNDSNYNMYCQIEELLYKIDAENNKVQLPTLPKGIMDDDRYFVLQDRLIGVNTVYNNLLSSIYVLDGLWTKKIDIFDKELLDIHVGKEYLWIDYVENDERGYLRFDGNTLKDFSFEELGIDKIPVTNRELITIDEQDRMWFAERYSISKAGIAYCLENGVIEEYDINISGLTITGGYNQPEFDCNGNLVQASLTRFEIFHPDSSAWLTDLLPDRQNGDLQGVAIHPFNCRQYVAHRGGNSLSPRIYIFEDKSLVDSLVLNSDVDRIQAICIDSKGLLYIGTFESGMGIFDGQSWEWFRQPFQILGNHSIREIKESPNGDILISAGKALVVYDGVEFVQHNFTNSPLDSWVNGARGDRDGNIYVFKGFGFYKFDGEEWEHFSIPNDDSEFVTDMWQDEIGNFYVSTYSNGLFYWNGYGFEHIHIMNSAIPSNRIDHICPHPDGDLWLSVSMGITIFKRDQYKFKNGVFGKTYYDSDLSGTYNLSEDVGMPGQKVILLPEQTTSITDQNGNYSFYISEDQECRLEFLKEEDFEFTSSAVLDTIFEGEDLVDLNCGLWKEVEDDFVEVDLTVGPLVCLFDIPLWISIKNRNWERLDGELTINLPYDLKASSTQPSSISGLGSSSVTFEFTDLGFQEQKMFFVSLVGPGFEDIVEIHGSIDDVFLPFIGELKYNNLVQEISSDEKFLCAYDPNDKLAESIGPSKEEYSLLDDALIYTIRFQNEGNYKATNVTLRDTIDDKLNINSLKIIASSYPMSTTIHHNREVVFRFSDIDLPPKDEDEARSQGFVKYQIDPLEGLEDGTLIENTAFIYFDFNSPIVTNTTQNILVNRLPSFTGDSTLSQFTKYKLFPNPSTGNVHILPGNDQSYSLMIIDAAGNLINRIDNIRGTYPLDFPHSGIYFIQIITNENREIAKVLINR